MRWTPLLIRRSGALALWLVGAPAQAEGPPAPVRCGPAVEAVVAPAYAPSLRCDAAGCCTLGRAELQALTLNPTPLLRELRLVPTDGKPKTENNPRAAGLGPTRPGLRVFGLRKDTLFHRLGVRNGDVLVALDGASLAEPAGVLRAVGGLAVARVIELTVERFGAPAPLRFVLVPTDPDERPPGPSGPPQEKP